MVCASGISSAAYADVLANNVCDPKTPICISSARANTEGTFHYVDSILDQSSGQSGGLDANDSSLYVQNSDGGLVYAPNGATPTPVGKTTVPVGDNANTQLIRGVAMNPGFSFQITSGPGPDQDSCNSTAMGFIYEHTLSHTTIVSTQLLQNGTTIGTFQLTSVDEPYSTNSNVIPCQN